jgi:CRP-like cAMP-binding protein
MATKAEKLLAKGQALDKKGKREKALELYREACAAEPYDPDPWTIRSETAHALGLTGEAAEALFHVCELFARSGMTTDALETAKRVLVLEPGHGGARRLAKMLEARAAEVVIEMEADEPTPPPAEAPAPAPEPPPRAPEARKTMMVPVVPPPAKMAAPAPVAPTPPEPDFGFDATDRGLEDLSLSEHLHGVGEAGEVTLDEQGIDVLQAVASTISTSPLLSELDSDLVRHLVDAGRLQIWGGLDVIVRQGEIGTSLYLILEGEVAVEREEPGREPRELARLRPGAFFGEMALLTNLPRSATVRATKSSYVLEISRGAVRDMIRRDGRILKLLMRFFRARLVGTHLQTSELFRRFSREEKRSLVARFRLRELGPDQIVVREGQRAEGLFLVLVGRLEVAQTDTRVLGELGPGDVFGEMSLLGSTETIATVRTSSRAWVLFLPAAEFHALVEEHPAMRDHLADIAAKRHAQNRGAVARPLREDHVEPV